MRTLPLLLVAACEITVTQDKGPRTPSGDTAEPPTTETGGPEDADADGFAADTDCDDADPRVHPGAEALCDVTDADCDGQDDADRTLVPTDEADLGAALAAGGLVCLEAGDHAGAALTGGSARLGAVTPGTARVVGSGGPALVVDGGAELGVAGVVLTGDSGVLVVTDAALTLDGVTIDGPDCACEGSVLVAEDATLVVRDSTLRGVRQTSGGEGPVRLQSSVATLERVRVEDTVVTALRGGVFALRDSTFAATDLAVVDTHLSGGGTLQGGVFFAVDTTVTLDRAAVLGLTLDGSGLSGGVFYGFGATFDVEELAVAGTVATMPGQGVRGLVAELALDGGFTAVDSTFVDGHATADTCVGLGFESVGPALALTNVVVQGYTCPTTVSFVDVTPSTTTSFTYDAFSGNDGGWDDVPDPVGTDGVIATPATFLSPTPPWDLAPDASSPMVDQGDPARTDPDGSRSDIGAAGSTVTGP